MENQKNCLVEILKCTDRRDDAVLGNLPHICNIWYGPLEKETNAAILSANPIEQRSGPTYVSRILAFLFADTESFATLLLVRSLIELHIFLRNRTPDLWKCLAGTRDALIWFILLCRWIDMHVGGCLIAEYVARHLFDLYLDSQRRSQRMRFLPILPGFLNQFH